MQREVIGLVAFDLVLRVIARGMMNIALPGHIPGVDCDYRAAHEASF